MASLIQTPVLQNQDDYGSVTLVPHTGTADESCATLSFHKIDYEVQVKQSPCSCSAEPKQILKNINGIFKPGLNAVMGPTGSGKSSLLDILAGRKDPRGQSGYILLDSQPLPQNFKLLVGYVAQTDCVSSMLSIRENFAFSAALRLPKSVSKQEKKRRVDQVLTELGLMEVADSKVGNEFIRGISGGEKKRCNIGMELIISPPVLFLDEPTTGLDASTANAVIHLLKNLSKRGRNIIFSIHQPRYSIFRTFDTLMLLSKGEAVYHGPCTEAVDYFATIGYTCDQFNNPADFFLDVINGDSTAVATQKTRAKLQENGTAPEDESKKQNGSDDGIDASQLGEFYARSEWYRRMDNELSPILQSHISDVNSGNVIQIRTINYKTSFLSQVVTVSGRAIKNLLRNPQVYAMQFFVVAVFALIVGGIYFKIDESASSGIQNRAGAFFFIIMNQVFGNMSAVELFIRERAIFIHENTSGFYRVSAYFIAKVFCDLIPMRMVPVIIFSAMVYWMIGFRDGIEHFGIFTLCLFLTAISASALSFLISSSVRILAIANLCLALSYVFMMLFSGLLINIGDLGDWISWIKYLSIFRYSLNALSVNELQDRCFCDGAAVPPPCVTSDNNTCIYGNDYLSKQDIEFKHPWDLWQNLVAMAALTLGFLFLAYVQLRRIKKLN